MATRRTFQQILDEQRDRLIGPGSTSSSQASSQASSQSSSGQPGNFNINQFLNRVFEDVGVPTSYVPQNLPNPVIPQQMVPIPQEQLDMYGSNVLNLPVGMTPIQRLMRMAAQRRQDFQDMVDASKADFTKKRDTSIADFQEKSARARAYFMQQMKEAMNRYKELQQPPDIPPEVLKYLRDDVGMRWKDRDQFDRGITDYPMTEPAPAATTTPATTTPEPVAETTTTPVATTETTTPATTTPATTTPATTTTEPVAETTTTPVATTETTTPTATTETTTPTATTETTSEPVTVSAAAPAPAETVVVSASPGAEGVTRSARD